MRQRRIGGSWQLAITLHNLGNALVGAGRAGEAVPHRQEALTLLSRFEDARATALARRVTQALWRPGS